MIVDRQFFVILVKNYINSKMKRAISNNLTQGSIACPDLSGTNGEFHVTLKIQF